MKDDIKTDLKKYCENVLAGMKRLFGHADEFVIP
jgi:hypothetical protein